MMEMNKPYDRVEYIEPDDTALVRYTAGVTGYPKAVELTYKNIQFDIY